MLNSQAEFGSRRSEVEEYLAYLRELENRPQLSVTLMNTMKSSALLMMYNIVESTMSNLLQDLFDSMEVSQVRFETLSRNMREVVLGNIRRGSSKAILERMDASSGFVLACFERTDAFSGNLDAKVIRATLSSLGIQGHEKHKEGKLLIVKNERNSLAHGSKSFSDCGKSYSVVSLIEINQKVCGALEAVIKDVTVFLDSKAYLKLDS